MSKKRAPKKAAGKKPAPKGSAPKSEAASAQPDDSPEFVVFAFRLTRAERDLIHQVAGSAKASRLVKGAAIAAATKDVDAFKTLIAEVESAEK